jgi:hypothetical protein
MSTEELPGFVVCLTVPFRSSHSTDRLLERIIISAARRVRQHGHRDGIANSNVLCRLVVDWFGLQHAAESIEE